MGKIATTNANIGLLNGLQRAKDVSDIWIYEDHKFYNVGIVDMHSGDSSQTGIQPPGIHRVHLGTLELPAKSHERSHNVGVDC